MRASAGAIRAAALILWCVGVSRPVVAATGAADDPGPYRVKREYGRRVVMPDGVTLVADVYRPETPKRVP